MLYRLWTLLALNSIELSRRYRLKTVYTESYWHINSTELTLHEHYIIQKEQTALNAAHNRIHTTKHLKSHDDILHHTAISCHHFTLYALLHHTILHHFTLCSPSRPQTFHIIQHTISTSHLITNIYLPSVVSFNSALNTHLFSSGLWLLCLCAWSCVPLVSCVCVCSGHIPHHKCCSVYVISRVQIAFHITLLNSTPH